MQRLGTGRRLLEELLGEALHHFRTMLGYANHDLDEQLVIDAVCVRLSAGLEVLNRLDRDVRDQLFGDKWTAMWGMRNRIAHGYLLVSAPIIRRTLEADIPELVEQIEQRTDSPGDTAP